MMMRIHQCSAMVVAALPVVIPVTFMLVPAVRSMFLVALIQEQGNLLRSVTVATIHVAIITVISK